MKFAHISRSLVTVTITVFLLLGSTQAWSQAAEINPTGEKSSPPIFDLFILRPIGMVALAAGSLLFLAPVAPLTLITKPTQIGKPFDKMVMQPARYLVADPLGEH
jgi:hypothetical protein